MKAINELTLSKSAIKFLKSASDSTSKQEPKIIQIKKLLIQFHALIIAAINLLSVIVRKKLTISSIFKIAWSKNSSFSFVY